jgi:hypothetical protein
MRFRLSKDSRGFVLAMLVAAAIIAPILAGTATSTAASTGFAYDELLKVITSGPLPQPGNFAPDFKSAMDMAVANANPPKHHGLFAKMQDMADKAKATMAMMKNGTPSTHYFLNEWERTDNPGTLTATIIRPDRHQIIHLDLAAKTYRIEDIGTMPVTTDSPPPYQGPPGQEPSPQPGTGKMDITTTSTEIGPKTIDNVHTVGYSQEFKIVSTQSTGSCQDGTFDTSLTEYVSDITPPLAKANPGLKYSLAGHPPLTGGARPGCNPTTTMHHSGGATPPGDRLNIWTLMTIKAGTAAQQGAAGGSFSMLTERGNVRDLGSADASLFDIPAGFTKQP